MLAAEAVEGEAVTTSRLRIDRISYGPNATIGLMRWESHLIYTLEDAWRDNAVGDSCIPDGVYPCRPRIFHHGGYPAVEVCDVPGRTTILFHRGNDADDVRGCIVQGIELDVLEGRIAVLHSAAAWAIFFPAWGGRDFELDIGPIDPALGTHVVPIGD